MMSLLWAGRSMMLYDVTLHSNEPAGGLCTLVNLYLHWGCWGVATHQKGHPYSRLAHTANAANAANLPE